ncbi:hypothetical protein [Labilithrix luteola]|nr:hypothetical protein [Labilithrix luteola]
MNRARIERLLLATTATSLVVLVPWFVSCAASDSSPGSSPDGSDTTIGETGADADAGAANDAASEAGCDASDDACVSTVISCSNADWCPEDTGVSTNVALTSVWGSGPKDVWASGSAGTLAHYDGTAWVITPTKPAVQNTFQAVWGSGPNDVWAVSMTDVIFHSTGFANGTAKWEMVTAATPSGRDFTRVATALWGTGPDDVRIGARAYAQQDPETTEYVLYNQFTKTTAEDGGLAWTEERGDGTVHAFWGSSANDFWYVADNSPKNGWQRGLTMHATRGAKGLQWQNVDSQSSFTLEGIWGSSANDVWAVGDKGTLRHFTGGARWDIVESVTNMPLHAVWGTAANDIWAVGEAGTILHFDGTEWKPSTAAFKLGNKPNLLSVWGSSANDVWIVGDSVALHYTGPKGDATK